MFIRTYHTEKIEITKNSYEHFYTEQTDKVKKAFKSKTERKVQREVKLRKEKYGDKKTEEEIIKVFYFYVIG